MKFTDENVRRLFGHEAAEDDNEDNFYFSYVKGQAFERLKSNLPLYVVVGHKGTGKSAILKVLEKEENDCKNLPIAIRQEDIFDQTEKDFSKMIVKWQEGLSKIIFNKLIESIKLLNTESSGGSSFKKWLAKFSDLTLELLKKRYTDLKKNNIDISYKDFLKLFKSSLFEEKKVTVFIDDLDRGWKNADYEIQNISALLNALRTITREVPNVKFRIALRSSVYYAVRTSDESTDKIESSIVWLKWTNHEILAMLAKRIMVFKGEKPLSETALLNKSQIDLAQNFSGIFEKTFKGGGQWRDVPIHRVLLSLIRQRPRDLVKLCTLAAQNAYNHNREIITTDDLKEIFQRYSNERLTDTINEYQSELSDLQKVLLEMKPSKNSASPFIYTPSTLMRKMNEIINHIGELKFASGDTVTARRLATFLYKINFFTARKDTSEQIVRYYYDENKYACNDDTDFGFNFEVHPAYRWALQPQNINKIYEEIELIDD